MGRRAGVLVPEPGAADEDNEAYRPGPEPLLPPRPPPTREASVDPPPPPPPLTATQDEVEDCVMAFFPAPGSAGNAAEACGRGVREAGREGAVHVAPGTVRPAGPVELGLLMVAEDDEPPRRVLCLSRSTRVEDEDVVEEGALGNVVVEGDADAAAAHPLVDVVAPCIPPSVGSEG